MYFAFGRVDRIRRDHRERDLRAFGTSNQINDLRQPHVHDVDRFAFRLLDGDDAVAWFDLSALLGRSFRYEAFDLAVAVL